MTPREFAWETESALRRSDDDRDRQIILAYQIERVRVLSANAAHGNRPMPSLKELLGRGTSLPRTREQQLALYEMYSTQYKLKTRKVIH